MVYKFTLSSEKVLQIARELAENMGHNYIGTEHLLYGLVSESNGVAGKTLKNQGITCEIILEKIEELIGSLKNEKISILGFTPRTKKVIENAFEESQKINSKYIGTEHLLLGILKETDSIAIRILEKTEVRIESIYNDIAKVLNDFEYFTNDNNSGSEYTEENSYKLTKKLNQFSTDLTLEAQNGNLDPVIGRERENERIIEILSRRTKNNPCLIGEPGVGKTAVIEGLAQKIFYRKCSRCT